MGVATISEIPLIVNQRCHKLCVTGLSWPSHNTLYSASLDATIVKWDVTHSMPPYLTDSLKFTKAITCISASARSDGNLLAYGSFDNIVRIWDSRAPPSIIAMRLLAHHKQSISTIDWNSENNHLVASGSFDGDIIVWDERSSLPLSFVNKKHDGKILTLSWLGMTILASGGTDCAVRLHNCPV